MSQKQHLVQGKMENFDQVLLMFKSRIWNSVFAVRCNSMAFEIVYQHWVKHKQAKVVMSYSPEADIDIWFQ